MNPFLFLKFFLRIIDEQNFYDIIKTQLLVRRKIMKYLITSYDHFGRGITYIDGKITFVKGVRIGDEVEVNIIKDKKKYSIGKVKESKNYSSIFCPYYYICGGCQLEQLSYQEQLEFKKNKALDILTRYAGIDLDKIDIIPSKEKYYRNKVVFHIEEDKIGFYEEESNKLLDIDKCYLVNENITRIYEFIKNFIKDNRKLKEVMIRSFDNNSMISFKGKCAIERLNYFKDKVDSCYLNETLVFGSDKIKTKIFDMDFYVGCDAFFQINSKGLESIYKEVIDIVKRKDINTILDLYCGTGTISLLVSPYVKKVYGVEIVKEGIIDANYNKKINNIDNVEFFCMDAKDFLEKYNKEIDMIIIDPPRSGLSNSARRLLLDKKCNNIIYISCDLMSFARDIKELSGEYKIKSINLVDEFPNTYHVETIALLDKL